MTGLRPLARLAVRDARHHPWRSALIVVLIALPVAAFVFGMIGMRTVPNTGAEIRAKSVGAADTLVVPKASREAVVSRRLRDAGFRVVPWEQGQGVLRAGTVRMSAVLAGIDVRDPLTTGLWDLRSGSLPARTGEVLLTRAAARRLGVGVGDTVVLEESSRRFTVTGLADGSRLDVRQMVGRGVMEGLPSTLRSSPQLLVGGTPTGARALEALAAATSGPDVAQSVVWPATVNTAAVGRDAQALLYMLGTLGLMAFGLVVASAMAVGARRQLRVLGLLGAAGASPRQRSGSMLLQGASLGAAGTALGIAGGLVAWSLGRDALENWYGEPIGDTVIATGDMLLVVVVALAVAIGASLLPARVAARTSVLQALGGRRPTPRVPVRMPVAGVALSGIGLVMLAYGLRHRPDSGVPLVATAGVALTVAGTVVAVPYLVGLLERAAGVLRGTGRLAVRDVARHRGRTGPVVAAVMATGALALAGGILATSSQADSNDVKFSDPLTVVLTVSFLRDGLASIPDCDALSALAAPVTAVLPGASRACLRTVSDGTTAPIRTVAAGELVSLGLDAHRRDLEGGGVLSVAFPGGFPAPDQVVITTPDGPVRPRMVPVQVRAGVANFVGGGVLADPDTVRRWLPRAVAYDTSLVFNLPAPISDLQRAALTRLSDDLGLRLDRDATLSASLQFDQAGGFSVGRVIYGVILPRRWCCRCWWCWWAWRLSPPTAATNAPRWSPWAPGRRTGAACRPCGRSCWRGWARPWPSRSGSRAPGWSCGARTSAS
ncbi:MAG: FtsX-like permease family protein [Thermoleophilia bacterium]